jgi:predicted regulator of Ras-like GTPase activity (Roadblock/LC7/MglB family)
MIQLDQQAGLTHTLQEVADQGHFEAVVLVGDEGLPLAIGSSTYSAETVAAMVTLVKGLVEQTQAELGLGTVDEVSIAAEDKVQLVCRYFSVAHEALTLAVIAPANQSYRRLTNKAIREIKAIL